jgi:diguanylate cyclase (GGDEF)-like protein
LIIILEGLIRRFGFFYERQAVWWPTNGLCVALLLRTERRKWPWILGGALLGSLVGQLNNHTPSSLHLFNIVGNAAGALLAALMLPHFEKLERWLQEPRLVSRFVAFAIVLAPLISATVRASYLPLVLHRPGFWIILQRRGIADMLGYALFTPLALTLSSRETYRPVNVRRLLRTVMLLALMAAAASLVFTQSSYALAFILVSVSVLIALHLGFSASVIAVNMLAVITTAQTMHGHGPFTLGGGVILSARVALLQSFLTLSMITVFAVSVIQVEREIFQAKLKLAYEQMEQLATTDPLTGVGNRRRFEEALEIEWARAYRTGDSVGLLMIDADDFKSYNDSYGHPAGDDCLRILARTIRKMERRSTDLLARYGGEEFIFLLPTNTAAGATHIGETIRLDIEKLHEQQETCLKRKVTVSIGCAAVVPGPGLSSKMLIGASDQALYRAKQNGRNCVEVGKVATGSQLYQNTSTQRISD